jgi:hypothetical protein
MNTQAIAIIIQNDEHTTEADKRKEVVTLTPELLGMVGGGEGMICIG